MVKSYSFYASNITKTKFLELETKAKSILVLKNYISTIVFKDIFTYTSMSKHEFMTKLLPTVIK